MPSIGCCEVGLVVSEPWLTRILEKGKRWEMRSAKSNRRGPIALIEKGSGQVVGVAELVDVKGPFGNKEMAANEDSHQIPSEIYGASDYKWHYAWVLENATALPSAVPYKHKNGAVIWVQLDEQTQQGIAEQLTEMDWPLEGSPIQARAPRHGDSEEDPVTRTGQSGNDADSRLKLPMAKDGSLFSRDTCQRGGKYTVGEKGGEVSFQNFEAALDYLRKMPAAKWRRPNDKGNWGIVTAVSWVEADQGELDSFKFSHGATGPS
ncbi:MULTISPECIES: ASCH domain-containing protein [Marinobacter]|uniref:ASCH domain-containing protein n=1 Tax=Marinobacter TaxID=2742 RepID=UPI001925B423|nr:MULTISPECIES: ASCH domain-containing protein [Marinobacter]MBL3554762.1 hypothetical protein [Marinobacter sp. JB05H06]